MNSILIQSLAALTMFQDDTFRVQTRVINVEAIVRDADTRLPVTDLSSANFRLKIDGKPRKITYFQHRGDNRRPLAMLIYFNLAPDGALRQMSTKTAQNSFTAALSKLEPTDEVTVFASRDWFVGAPTQVSPLSVDRAQSCEALQKALEGAFKQTEEQRKQERHNKEQSMSHAVDEAISLTRLRPESQVVLVFISDGMNTLDTMEGRSRDRLARVMSEHNISFSALTVDMLASYAAAAALINPVGKMFGMSVTGSGDSFAKQTGGVALKVHEPGLLGEAMGQILSAYDSRYSLGYQAADSEYRDDRWHKIEVELEHSGPGKLTVSARKFWRASLTPKP